MKLAYNAKVHGYWFNGTRQKNVTNVAKFTEDTERLEQWKERQIALGFAEKPALLEQIRVDPDNNGKINAICEEAMSIAGAHAGRDRGLVLHEALEAFDMGKRIILSDLTSAAIENWQGVVTAMNWEVLYVERVVCWPKEGICGRFDRIMRGETCPVCKRDKYIIDFKGGARVLDYPKAIATQLAMYVMSEFMAAEFEVGADHKGNTEDFSPMPQCCTCRGYVIHMPPDAEPQLVELDLNIGIKAVETLLVPIIHWRALPSKNVARVVPLPGAQTDAASPVARSTEDPFADDLDRGDQLPDGGSSAAGSDLPATDGGVDDPFAELTGQAPAELTTEFNENLPEPERDDYDPFAEPAPTQSTDGGATTTVALAPQPAAVSITFTGTASAVEADDDPFADLPGEAPAPTIPPDAAPETARVDATFRNTEARVKRRENLRDRLTWIKDHDMAQAQLLASQWPAGMGSIKTALTDADMDLVEALVIVAERAVEAPFNPIETAPEQPVNVGSPATPPASPAEPAPSRPVDFARFGEGPDMAPADIDALRAQLELLENDQFDRVESWAAQADVSGNGISLRRQPSKRRFSIARFMLMAVNYHEDQVRAVLAGVVNAGEEIQTTVTTGSVLGVLTQQEAETAWDALLGIDDKAAV